MILSSINYNDSVFYKYVTAELMFQDYINIKNKHFCGSDSTIFFFFLHSFRYYTLHFPLQGLRLLGQVFDQ